MVFAGTSIAILAIALPIVIMLLFAWVYTTLRIRDAHSEHPDPELGLKSVYWMLFSLGLFTMHLGVVVLTSKGMETILDLQSSPPPQPRMNPRMVVPPPSSPTWSEESRNGWALITAGSLVSLLFYLLGAYGTRNWEWPTVRRAFLGGRIAMLGLFVTLSFTFMIIMLFQINLPKGGGLFEFVLASLMVLTPSLIIHVLLFRWGGPQPYYCPPKAPNRKRPKQSPLEADELPEIEPLPMDPGPDPRPRRRPQAADDDDPRDNDEQLPPRRRRPADDD